MAIRNFISPIYMVRMMMKTPIKSFTSILPCRQQFRRFTSRPPSTPTRPLPPDDPSAPPLPPPPVTIRRPTETHEFRLQPRRKLFLELPKTTVRADGLTIASAEDFVQPVRFAVVIKAGPRYESHSERGVTHCIRRCAGADTSSYSGFLLNGLLNNDGAKTKCQVSREHISYLLISYIENTENQLKFFSSIVCGQAFKPWQVKEEIDKLKIDIANFENQKNQVLVETLHQIAFRSGLKNSIYCPREMLEVHNSETMKNYYTKMFTADRVLFAALGVPLEKAVDMARRFKFNPSRGIPEVPTELGGGEIRIDSVSKNSCVAFGMSVLGTIEVKDHLASMVLHNLLGGIPLVKEGNPVGKIGKTLKRLATKPFSGAGFNYAYSDARLFGFMICGAADEMRRLMEGGIQEMAAITSNLSEDDVAIAKSKALGAVVAMNEYGSDQVYQMANNLLCRGEHMDFHQAESILKNLTVSEIRVIAEKIFGGKLCMAAVGNLSNTPYLDELRPIFRRE